MRSGRVVSTVGRWSCVAVVLVGLCAAPARANDGGGAGLLDPVVIDVGTAWGGVDEEAIFEVKLTSSTGLVTGAQIDINFDSQTPIAVHPNPDFNGGPFCDVNPAINKDQSTFAFQGPNGIRAIIASTTNIDLIPNGATLFTCRVHISASAPTGTYPLPCSNAQSHTALSVGLPTTCHPGAVEVIEHADIDHYKCYQGSDLKDPKFSKRIVDLTDQIVSDQEAEVLKLTFVCAPVDKDGQGINNPGAHLACYKIKAGAVNGEPKALVSTQFQTSQFVLQKPAFLCLPATKTLIP